MGGDSGKNVDEIMELVAALFAEHREASCAKAVTVGGPLVEITQDPPVPESFAQGMREIADGKATEFDAADQELRALRERIAELNNELSAERFWREHTERTNDEFERDYLEIWQAVKEPNKTVLASVLALRAALVDLLDALAGPVGETSSGEIAKRFFAAERRARALMRKGQT